MSTAYLKIQSVSLGLLLVILVDSCTPSAMLQSSARPAVTTAGSPLGHYESNPSASSFLYPFEEEAGEEHTLFLSWSLLLSLGACLAHLSQGSWQSWMAVHEGRTSDHTTRLVLGAVEQDIAINPFNKCSICGLKGVK